MLTFVPDEPEPDEGPAPCEDEVAVPFLIAVRLSWAAVRSALA